MPPRKPKAVAPQSISESTERAIAAADHLTDMDAGAVETLRYLAVKIDTEERLRERALEYAAAHDEKPPPLDNVTIPTYLKYCLALGLVPESRSKLDGGKQPAPSKPKTGTVAHLRDAAMKRTRSA